MRDGGRRAARDRRATPARARSHAVRRSIELRNPYVDPMNAIQVELLRRHRARRRVGAPAADALDRGHRRGAAQHGLSAPLRGARRPAHARGEQLRRTIATSLLARAFSSPARTHGVRRESDAGLSASDSGQTRVRRCARRSRGKRERIETRGHARLVRVDALCVRQRARDVVQAVEQRLLRSCASNSNAMLRPPGCSIASRSRSTVSSFRSSSAACSSACASGASTIGARPVLIAFVRKMSPNDGAITTRKP